MIDDDEADPVLAHAPGDLLHLTGTQQGCRPRPRQGEGLGKLHLEADGLGQANRLLQTIPARTVGARGRLAVALVAPRPRRAPIRAGLRARSRAHGKQHERTQSLRAPIDRLATFGWRGFVRRGRCRTRYA